MEGLNSILQFPDRCLLNKKITKAFFKRNFNLTSAERSLLDDYNAIESINWLAGLSPANTNIPAFQDEWVSFEEVQVISVQSSANDFDRNKQKIAELIQKYIPYPMLLCIYHTDTFVLNTCDKKINQNDPSRRTIERRYFTENISVSQPTSLQQDFLKGFNFAILDKTSLQTCYNTYTQLIVSLQAANLTGFFSPRSYVRTKEDVARLSRIDELTKEISLLHSQAQKETQLNVRVNINMLVNNKRKEIESLTTLL